VTLEKEKIENKMSNKSDLMGSLWI